ncbi:uncharacterized protein [Oncorhynchus clarkii lewisi]|uniref:uncharacterized protein n=1 Tax=Oncorhynchus clarkii lewisi TaxID=490388 RepID=UPI0039B86361
MGVVSATSEDTKAPHDYSPTAPQADNTNTASAPPSLYPEIPIEVAQPPPYSMGHNQRGPFHNPFKGNPFLTRTQPTIQAPLLSVQAGQLKGAMSFGITGGQIMCEQITTSTPGPGNTSQEQDQQCNSGAFPGTGPLLIDLRGSVGSLTSPKSTDGGVRFLSPPNPAYCRECSPHSLQAEEGSCQSQVSQAMEDDEDSNRHAPIRVEVEYEIQDLRRQLNKSIALARGLMGVEGEGMGEYHIEGIVKGKVTDVTDTQRATTIRMSARQAGLRAKGVTAREHWDSERGGACMFPLRPAADPRFLEYQPWKMTDLTTLMEQMPSLHGGASAWLLQLQTLTSGLNLCLGDMKALLARAEHTLQKETMLPCLHLPSIQVCIQQHTWTGPKPPGDQSTMNHSITQTPLSTCGKTWWGMGAQEM